MDFLKDKVICIIGAAGAIGTELALELRKRYGKDNIIPVGRKTKPIKKLEESGPFFFLDLTDYDNLLNFCKKHKVEILINMAALLSATGEKIPDLCWKVNVVGWMNCLNVARELKMKQMFFPSSIAAFGPNTPKIAPNDTILRPCTMYGITKVTGELLGNYYKKRFGVDIRGIRYPGIISSEVLPGGGTTDYSVEIFYSAVKYKKYKCYLKKDTKIPMLYMPDCIKSTIDLMNAEGSKLIHGSDFNVGAFSFTPEEVANEIKKFMPNFEMEYEVDQMKQEIADSWPDEVDDSEARKQWGWKPDYDLAKMTKEMLEIMTEKFKKGELNYVNKDYE